MNDFTTDVIEIPSENIEKLTKKVDQINKKAVKNGLVPMVLEIGDVIETHHEKQLGGLQYTTLSYPVTISGEYPAINGWKCIAKIDHRDGVNIISIYDEIDVSKWRERKPTCDHCGHNKIKVQSYLIQNIESNEIMQIGKSCISDYIQGDPKWMLQMLQWVTTLEEQLEEEFVSCGSVEHYYDVSRVAQVSAMSIRKNGFVGSESYDGAIPTKSDVFDYFFGKRDSDWVAYWNITDEDKKIGDATVEYFLNQDADNNFTITLKQLMELGQVRGKFFAYIAGGVSGYLKHLDREVKKSIDAKILRVNGTVGEIKKRQDFDVILESVITASGFYGTTFIHKFRKNTGETIIWFCNGNKIDAEIGENFTIKATVKKYDSYNDWKQTIVTRAVKQ